MDRTTVGSGKVSLKSPSRFAKRIHGYRGGRPLTPREQSMDRKKHPHEGRANPAANVGVYRRNGCKEGPGRC